MLHVQLDKSEWNFGTYIPNECCVMIRETGVQSLVESYQRLKKWYLVPPLHLGIVAYEKGAFWTPSTTITNLLLFRFRFWDAVFVENKQMKWMFKLEWNLSYYTFLNNSISSCLAALWSFFDQFEISDLRLL